MEWLRMKRNFCGDIRGDAEGGRHTTTFWNNGLACLPGHPQHQLSVVQTEQAPCPRVGRPGFTTEVLETQTRLLLCPMFQIAWWAANIYKQVEAVHNTLKTIERRGRQLGGSGCSL